MRLAALAEALGARLIGEGAGEITAVAALDAAGATQLAALFEPRWRAAARATRAGAVLVTPALAESVPEGSARLVIEDARAAWGRALRILHREPAVALPPVGV